VSRLPHQVSSRRLGDSSRRFSRKNVLTHAAIGVVTFLLGIAFGAASGRIEDEPEATPTETVTETGAEPETETTTATTTATATETAETTKTATPTEQAPRSQATVFSLLGKISNPAPSEPQAH
jgi:hypothetical protein